MGPDKGTDAAVRRHRVERRLAAILIGVGTLACSTEPNAPSVADVIIAGGESGRLVLIDTEGARVVGQSPDVFPRQQAWASWPGSGSALFSYGGTSGWFLAAVDIRTGRIKWEEPLADNAHDLVNHQVALGGGTRLEVLPDNRTLVAASAVSQGVRGVARFDLETRQVTGFIGPMDVASFSTGTVRRTSDGTLQLVILGSRTDLQDPGIHLFIADPVAFTVVDSIALEPPLDQTQQVLADPVGYGVYLGGDRRVDYLSFDERRVTATVSLPVDRVGSMAVAPTGSYVVITDGGFWPDSPGTRKVIVLDRRLTPLREFSLGTVSGSSEILLPVKAVFIDGGARLLVSTGTASRGPLYGTQRSELTFVDPATGHVSARLQLDDWRAGVILPLKP